LKFYSHCEAYHSIIRRYDHPLVKQYGRHINLLHKLNVYIKISTTLYIAEIEADSLLSNNLYSACIDDREKWEINSRVFFFRKSCFYFFFIRIEYQGAFFTPAFFSSFIINISVSYVKSNSLLIHSIVSDNDYLFLSFHKPSHKGYTFPIGISD